MKRISILSIFIILLLVGMTSSFQLDRTYSNSDSIYIKVRALDLSEDFSRMSSKNDEVLMLLYPVIDSTQLGDAIIKSYYQFSDSNRTFEHSFALTSPTSKQNMLFFMIELDTDRSVDMIDSIVKLHYIDLRNAYYAKDYNAIEKILGDDDVLGSLKLREKQSPYFMFNIRGIYKLDKYDYSILMKY
ncbi:MAG: hypothetical protein U0U66_04275 [Cytophagaceae bacterium]